jgi:hypothetical protein
MTSSARRARSGIAVTAAAILAATLLTPTAAHARPSDAPTTDGPADYLVGATYFSGWHSGDNFHFEYKNGQDWRPDHPEREPLYGWYDDTQEVMDDQIVDASANGVDFFSFDWYAERPAIGDGGELGQLHNGMNLFRTSPENDRMSYVINYINGSSFSISALKTAGMTQAQYEVVRAAEWDLLTTQWVELFEDPSYLKVDGKPLLEIYDVQRFSADFSTGAHPDWNPHQLAQDPTERAVQAAAIQVLKDKAALAGFDDVLIGGGLQQPGFSGEYLNAHDYDGMYDWFSAYGWHDMKRVPDPDNNYYNLIRDNHDYVWDYYAEYKNPAVDYIPLVTSGWDDIVNPQYNKWSIDKTPEAFGDYLREAKSYIDDHPQTNLDPGTDLKIVKIGSWNELFEGHSIVPTKSEGDAYVSQVAAVFGTDEQPTSTQARAGDLADAVTELVSSVTTGAGYSSAATTAARIAGQRLVASLPEGQALRNRLRLLAPVMRTLERLVGDDARFAATNEAWTQLVQQAFGTTVTVSADDYSVTTGQTVDLGFDIASSQTVTNAQWTLRYPDTWPAADVPATGTHPRTTLTVPTGVDDGVLYNVSDHFPGVGDTMGNRQAIAVDYQYTAGGVQVSGSSPLTLTIVPSLTSRLLASSVDGGATDVSVWLHNQSHEPIAGELVAEPVAGVTIGAFTSSITLAPGERRETVMSVSNSTVADQHVPFEFVQTGGTTDLGAALITPVEVPYFATAPLDGAVRSDGLVEVSNSNGRVQVGNVYRPAEGTNTEYRPVLSFPLSQIEGDVVRVVLELTEFEAGSPPALTAERIAATSAITAGTFSAPALASAAFPIAGSPPSEGIVRRLDVTAWALDALAAGDTHLTIRVRMDTVVPGQTQYRTFRPTEYTPTVAKDAPQLKVVAAPQVTVSIPTTPTTDGNVRSDSIIELANANGRLQLGNVARANGTNTDYRTMLTFDLAALAGADIDRVRLSLTEFEAGGSPSVIVDRLAPTGTIVLAQYSGTALQSRAFPTPGAPTSAGLERTLDVTDWVVAAIAAGETHLTVRLRQDSPAVTATTYRAFRSSEWTPDDPADAPRLVAVVAG